MQERATLSDVALKANTSIRTVSRVINNSNLVSKKTRGRVLKAINELNFTPNIIARSLKFKSSKSIGVIVQDIYSPFFSPIIRGIESIATIYDYSVIVCESQYDYKLEKKHLQNFISRMVDGIITIPVMRDYSYLKTIADYGIKIVVAGKANNLHKNIASVHSDDYHGMLIAIQYLVDNGHNRIVFVNSNLNIIQKEIRLGGYKDSLQKNKIEFNEKLVFNTEIDIEGGYRIAKKIFNSSVNFTAIMCFNDLIAIGILKYCNENKIRIPEDFSIVGFDDIIFTQFLNPPLTTVHQQKTLLGKKIGELIFDLINNKKIDKNHIKFTPTLLIRKSVKKIN